MTALPCPFCGSQPERYKCVAGDGFLCPNTECRINGIGFPAKEWSTRPSAALTDEEKEALEWADVMEVHNETANPGSDFIPAILAACVRRLSSLPVDERRPCQHKRWDRWTCLDCGKDMNAINPSIPKLGPALHPEEPKR